MYEQEFDNFEEEEYYEEEYALTTGATQEHTHRMLLDIVMT